MKRLIAIAAIACSLAFPAIAAEKPTTAGLDRPALEQIQVQPAALQGAAQSFVAAAPDHRTDALDKMEEGRWIEALLALLFGGGALGMTTLAANKQRAFEGGNRNDFPVVAADIIYEGAAVGLVDASGHARPLTSADRFVGFAEAQADNSAGAAAAINVRVIESGKIQLSVTGAVITDVGQPVYAQDDDSFSFIGTSGKFIGIVHRFVSAGVVVVDFNAPLMQDPYGGGPYETKSANYTLDAEDTGKTIFVDTDAVVITLPAIADGLDACTIVNIAAFGAALVEIAPQAADKIHGPDLTAADDKSLLNTKATARRGDRVQIGLGDADGYFVQKKVGIWAREA